MLAHHNGAVLPLYPHNVPGTGATQPTLTVYLVPAEQATGAAMIVCPGGGYTNLAPHEGAPVARWLNSLGVTAYVLAYRLAPHAHHPMMLEDAARALRMVRANAAAWSIDAQRIGILGFSAGGHLASTLATHFDAGDATSTDPLEQASSRPDLAVLIYPVVTFEGLHAHAGSRTALLGATPDPQLISLLSNERQVTAHTPPMFLVHSADDEPVPAVNSLMLALALSGAGVPFELHVYRHGQHGYGLALDDSVLGTWPRLCASWLRGYNFVRE